MTEIEIPETAPDTEPDLTVDNRGRGCASGIARVQRALEDLEPGSILRIRSTDRRAKQEYGRLAAQTDHDLLAIETNRSGLLRKEYTTYLEIGEPSADD
ncbi:sulfurtransferase TusA family protein [Natrinema longum]|uniref:Sulfurtransferase TusA family protein n=1 Tax=Natrinema longum TaxID=370324 RepID=A0A8A2U815_9EURY|nr:sulfurtransferase TusA family protein [Natrinema longum]MBZ6493931.1 sulfurtransferase TusA family protein [Natrinema longum]QSW84733.1 sulfurtransferase TusA family protein [Natrinema longum]